jgi:hypothetical protein
MQALRKLAQKDVAENTGRNRQETMSPPKTANSNPMSNTMISIIQPSRRVTCNAIDCGQPAS